MTAFALWIVLLPTAASKFVLNLTPKHPMARVGDSLVLKCKASGCAEAVTFTWSSLIDRSLYGKTETNGTVSLQIFNPLGIHHINTVVCKATCRTKGEDTQNAQTSTKVNVYALPKDPTISRSDLLTEGQESNLTCTVPDVYPAERLIIEWLLGDEVLLKQDEHLEVQTVTSVLKYRPTAQNNGQNVTCRATLDIGIDKRTRETVASMTVQYSPRNITISENTQVKIGDGFTLTCRAEGSPEPTVLWRKLDQDGRSVVAGEGATLLVEEASWSHGGEYECVAHNVVGNLTAHMTVNVQGPPEKPVLYLSPSGELKAGDSVTITCQSESGPQGRVALRQLTGSQGAELESNQGHTSITVQSLTARDSGLYECQATNPYGKQTSSINITVFDELYTENQRTTATVASMTVQSLPKDPTISRSDLLTEGQESNLTCTVPDVYPAERLIIEWLLGDEVLLKQDEHLEVQTVTSVLKYRPTAQNNGQNVTCRATLDIGIDKRTRETVASMTVQYSPRNITISENTQVKIGDGFTLTCRAEGSPEPTVLWRKLDQDGRSVVAGEGATLLVEEASWSHDGEYECVAHNVVGNLTAHMTVNVQAPPTNLSVEVFPSAEFEKGQNVTIWSWAVGVPAPSATLVRLRDGVEMHSSDGTFHLVHLGPEHAGLYLLNVTNVVGHQSLSFSLSVSIQDKSVNPKTVIIPAACFVFMTAAATTLMRFLKRAKQASSYELARTV
ncbi:vascular cell adhesion protein 1-like [Oncorhynchus clarkii lewisi]|uniref:vascular cell adhesion protein 1-like n=1 Tax=Oncorhynchus clarkii lewisi TaxID=490388 RepID=UPI0039B83823